MLDQSFSTRSFLRLLTRQDPRKFDLGERKEEYKARLSEFSDAINKSDFGFSRFHISRRLQGSIYSPSNVIDEFALRKLNDNIKRVFNVRPSDRNKIIPQVITLLKEKIPFYVVKLDIKKFYQNIDRSSLIDRLKMDSKLSYRSKDLIIKLFSSPELVSSTGLPLGLSVSSTLAELYMEEFDAFCKRLESLYFYTRYVDDMLLFFHEFPKNIEETISKMLPGKLKLNKEKYNIFCVDRKGNCSSILGNKHLSFLGYDFHFKNSSKNTLNRMKVCISEKKIKKIKTRIMLSLFGFLKDNDFQLLQKRIIFLSSNYALSNEKTFGNLYSGIYFNYQYIDENATEALIELDRFLRRAVYSKTGSLGKQLVLRLSDSQKRQLCGYSFYAGYKHRIVKKFTHRNLKNIKGAWLHV